MLNLVGTIRPMRGHSGLAAVVLLAALHHLGAPALAAQAGTTTGIIRGTVRDPIGAPLAGAVVVIEHRETDLLTTVETNASGTFVRALLPPGTYDLTVAAATAGFGVERIEGSILRVGEMLDLAVGLRVVAAETVTVSSDLPAPLDTADVTSSQRVREEVVDGLPSNGRNYLNLTLLTPGASISQGPDGDTLNISGQRGIFNNVIVDGADFNNPFFGEQRGGQRPAFTFNQDAIEELVVVNQGATAEFGRSAGGFVNVITKSGTNDFAGSAHYFGQWDEVAAPFPGGARRREARVPPEPGRRDRGRPPRARSRVLLPRLRPAGCRRDQAGDPPRTEPGEPAAARKLSARALAGTLRQRVRFDPTHERRALLSRQA